MHPELSALSAQDHFLVWQMRPTLLLSTEASLQEFSCVLQAGEDLWGPTRSCRCKEQFVQYRCCWERGLKTAGAGASHSRPMHPGEGQRSAHTGPPASLGNPHMPLLLCQALCSPLVLKGISSLQHSLSIKGSGVPKTRLAWFCWPRVLLWCKEVLVASAMAMPRWAGTAPVGVALTWADHPNTSRYWPHYPDSRVTLGWVSRPWLGHGDVNQRDLGPPTECKCGCRCQFT